MRIHWSHVGTTKCYPSWAFCIHSTAVCLFLRWLGKLAVLLGAADTNLMHCLHLIYSCLTSLLLNPKYSQTTDDHLLSRDFSPSVPDIWFSFFLLSRYSSTLNCRCGVPVVAWLQKWSQNFSMAPWWLDVSSRGTWVDMLGNFLWVEQAL